MCNEYDKNIYHNEIHCDVCGTPTTYWSYDNRGYRVCDCCWHQLHILDNETARYYFKQLVNFVKANYKEAL